MKVWFLIPIIFCSILGFGLINEVSAQAVHEEFQETIKAEVLEVVEQFEQAIIGTEASTTVQILRVELKAGEREGEVVRLEHDLGILEAGDPIYVNRMLTIDGTEYFLFKDVARGQALLTLVGLLVLVTVIFAGVKGVKALLSLVLSLCAIIFILVPALLSGYSPALVSFLVAVVILAIILFFTHGLKPYVFLAFSGTILAVLVTCLLALGFTEWMHFTGFSADASVYLNFATGGKLDMSGLLLGAIIIGLLGVLDDVAITQASVVQELKAANSALRLRELYERAIKVGKDHIGSLINTLALAYVGTSLPLILLLVKTSSSLEFTFNQELVAAELARLFIGSIGLVLTVPLTTLIAAWYFGQKTEVETSDDHGHHHHH